MPSSHTPTSRVVLVTAHLLVLLAGTAAAARPAPQHHLTAAPAPMTRLVHLERQAVVRPVVLPVRHAAPAPRRTRRVVRVRVLRRVVTPRPVHHLPAAPIPAPSTAQQRLDRAVAALPGTPDPRTRWVITSAWGSWGTTDWYKDVVYISPFVPADRIYDVVAHEHGHLLSVAAYDGDVNAAVTAMDGWFGGTGLVGAERAADCLAKLQGATWTNYTSCTDQHWQAGARTLMAHHRL